MSEGLGGTLTTAGNCHWPTRCHGPAVLASVSRDSGGAATDRPVGRAAHCSHGYAGVSARPLVQLTNVYSRQRPSAGADFTQRHRPCQTGLRGAWPISCQFIAFSVRDTFARMPRAANALPTSRMGPKWPRSPAATERRDPRSAVSSRSRASTAASSCRLTFEVTCPLRRAGLARAETMYRVPQTGPRRPAVAGQVDRGVRRQRVDSFSSGLARASPRLHPPY